ncbi:MAG: J domain-containing protein [bacterium]|nr:J domain-containing protein [bacterium]
MRFDTIKISAFLVYMIQGQRPRMQVVDDGGDILHVRLQNGDDILIYLIENTITAYEIANILNENSARKVHSLFILWSDLLLPGHGAYYIPDDWMSVLLALHQDKIYAFDAFGPEVFIFPIFFEGVGVARDIRHGGTIDAGHLNAKRVKTPYAPDFWYVANFEVPAVAANPLQVYYDVLGIHPSTDRDLIKRAYRHLARRYHPDVNDTAEATQKMQQLNDAYARILRHLDEYQK